MTRSLRWLTLASVATYRKSVWFLRGLSFSFLFFLQQASTCLINKVNSFSVPLIVSSEPSMCKTREVAHQHGAQSLLIHVISYTCAFQVKLSVVETTCSPLALSQVWLMMMLERNARLKSGAVPPSLVSSPPATTPNGDVTASWSTPVHHCSKRRMLCEFLHWLAVWQIKCSVFQEKKLSNYIEAPFETRATQSAAHSLLANRCRYLYRCFYYRSLKPNIKRVSLKSLIDDK